MPKRSGTPGSSSGRGRPAQGRGTVAAGPAQQRHRGTGRSWDDGSTARDRSRSNIAIVCAQVQKQAVIDRGGEETDQSYTKTNHKALSEIMRLIFKHINAARDRVKKVFALPNDQFEDALTDMIWRFSEKNKFYLTNRNGCTIERMSRENYPSPENFYPIEIDPDMDDEQLRREWSRWCINSIVKDFLGITVLEFEFIFMHMLMALMIARGEFVSAACNVTGRAREELRAAPPAKQLAVADTEKSTSLLCLNLAVPDRAKRLVA